MMAATATSKARIRYVCNGLSSEITVVCVIVVVSAAGPTKLAGSIRVGWGV